MHCGVDDDNGVCNCIISLIEHIDTHVHIFHISTTDKLHVACSHVTDICSHVCMYTCSHVCMYVYM